MKPPVNQLGCVGCPVSRRSVLATGFAAGCAACLGDLSSLKNTAFGQDSGKVMRIRLLFANDNRFSDDGGVILSQGWPNIGYDYRPYQAEALAALRDGCQNMEFILSFANTDEHTQEILKADAAADNDPAKRIDGYIVVTSGILNAIGPIVETGKPAILTDFLYTGTLGFVIYTSSLIRAEKPNFAYMSSNRLEDLVAAAACFPIAKGPGGTKAFVEAVAKVRRDIVAGVRVDMKCTEDKFDIFSTEDLLKELKTKKMLAYEGTSPQFIAAAKETLGIEIFNRPFAELNDHWEKADKDQAREVLLRWKQTAASIMPDVPDDVLESSARMYLAEKQCLKDHDAFALTINCLGGFYGGAIHAYPCLGFYELSNEGLIGACECDVVSTLTMIVGTTLSKGRPGFISDPVLDVSTKQIIYAHCVATTKPFGPQGPVNPYVIMTHSEDRQGASVRSILPLGYMTTSMIMHPEKKEIVFHQAKSVANSTEDRACRTKLCAVPVGDYEKLFTQWDQWGWHRVTFYGDLKEPIFALADALGWKIVEEA